MQADALHLAGDRGRDGKHFTDAGLALFFDDDLQGTRLDAGQIDLDRSGQEGPDQKADDGKQDGGGDQAAHGSLPGLEDFDHVEIVDPAPDRIGRNKGSGQNDQTCRRKDLATDHEGNAVQV